VNNATTSVNQTVVVHLYKRFVNAAVERVVQGVTQPAPVCAGAHGTHLAKHGASAVTNKFARAAQKFLAADLVFVGSLFGQLLLYSGVYRQRGVVCARQP